MAKLFGFDPAVKRLERTEAKHSVIKIKETKTQIISHPDNAVMEALNHKGRKLHFFFFLFVTFWHMLTLTKKNILKTVVTIKLEQQ